MDKILLVSETKNFITSSLVKQLEENDCVVIQSGSSPAEIETELEFGIQGKGIQLIILYAEGEAAQKNTLVCLKDRAIKDNVPIFAIADVDEMRQIKEIIPENLIKMEFLRPVTVKDIISAVSDYLLRTLFEIKKRILVVDDSGAMLRNIKGWLEDKYDVILANSGAMAIKYLSMGHPDLILLDYEMPVCDGRQVLEMIRSEVDFADIPVIFLTSKNDKESVMKVTELKPEGYLLKTMEPAQIVAKIDEFFSKQVM